MTRTPAMNFRADIHGLRGIAILLVVLYHVHVPGFQGGFVGVDVFFVLSGYLITRLLVEELRKTGRIDLLQFYARRARRLLPAAAVVLVCTMAASLLLLSPLEQQNFAGSALATSLYASNLWFAKNATDYLAAPPDYNPFLHTWSLAVEEQFYLVWPMFVLLVGWRWRGATRRLAIAMAVLAATSFIGSVWLTTFAQPWAFFGSPTRAWEFALGGITAIAPPFYLNAWPRFTAALGWLGLAMLVTAGVALNSRIPFPGFAALLPVLGTVFVIVSEERSRHVSALLRARPLSWLGDVSYVWYLWHWPVLVFAQAIVPGLDVAGRAVFGVLSLVLAAATRSMLEDRVRFSPFVVARPAFSVLLALAVTVTNAGATEWWRHAAVREAASTPQQRFSFAQQDNPRVYRDGCHLTYAEVKSPECAFGDSQSRTTIVLFGDSHAAQWFPPLERIAQQYRWRLVSLTKSGCPAADIWPHDPLLGRPYTECDTWRRDSIARVLAMQPALVIVASASVYVDAPEHDRSTGTSSEEWGFGLRRVLDRFSGKGIRTAIMRDSPIPGFDIPTCLARASWRPWLFSAGCDFSRAESQTATVSQSELRAVTGVDGAQIVDISDAICATPVCDAMREGVVVYRDAHHLTASFSASLAPVLGNSLEVMVGAGGSRSAAISSVAEPLKTQPATLAPLRIQGSKGL